MLALEPSWDIAAKGDAEEDPSSLLRLVYSLGNTSVNYQALKANEMGHCI